MTDHKDRMHALLSPSGAHRWLNCMPSARLEEQFPDKSSEAADEGTLAHEICEAKLRHHFYTKDFNRRQFSARISKLKKHELYQPEMDNYTEEYKDFVHAAALAFPSIPHVIIESRVDLSKYVPDCSGTADCILIGNKTLHVIDFKYGKGVPVSAEHNEQLMLYALGAYDRYSIFYAIDTIRLSIVQPRIDNNNSGECSVEELVAWGESIKPIAEQAYKGEGEYIPGDWCKFCRARGACRARADENVKLAFEIGKKPPLISNDEIGVYLRKGQDVSTWLSDLEAYALAQCLAGNEVAGWKAVEGRGSRVWTDQEKAFKTLMDIGGIKEALLYERVPLSLAKIEKDLLGKKEFALLVGKYVKKNPGKPTLVPETDKREAITNNITAAEAFKKGDE